MRPLTEIQSDYMRFAKLETAARYNLAGSGVAEVGLADLGADIAGLDLHGDNPYGWPPLRAKIAERFSVEPACVVTAGGASFANHLAMAALLQPDDEVLIEQPTYPLLTSVLAYLGARVRHFRRDADRGWRLDPDEAARRLTPETRLVVITNPHNPSSAQAPDEAVRAIARAAARIGAVVLVDEVYRELTFASGEAVSVFDPAANQVVTSSLTKAYGLSGLRCGWILAPRALAERMRRLDDLFAARGPHLMERLSLAAFDRLDILRVRARRQLEVNRAAYRQILGDHPRLEHTVFDQGTTIFPRLRDAAGELFGERLRRHYDTSVVPGRFFGAPDHLRVGLGGGGEITRAGLQRVAAALDDPRCRD